MAYMKKEDYEAADRPKSQFQQKSIPLKELVCISCQSNCLTVFILPLVYSIHQVCFSWESIMVCANLQCRIANMKLLTCLTKCASLPIRCVDKALARREARKSEPHSKALHIQSVRKRT